MFSTRGRSCVRQALASAFLATALGLAGERAEAFELFGIHLWGAKENAEPLSPDAQRYTIDIATRSPDDTLKDRVSNASLLFSEKDQAPPPSTPAFLSRAKAEYGRVVAALYAEGYYGGTVTITVNGRSLDAIPVDARLPNPVPVRIDVDPGPQFTFGRVQMAGRAPLAADPRDRVKAPPEKLGLVPGAVAKSGTVLQSEDALVQEWRLQGYPKAKVTERNIVASHPTQRLDVDIGVLSGPLAVYGPISVTGTKDMDPDFVAWISGLRPGQRFNPRELEEARRRLRRLQVFNTTQMVEADAIGPGGTLPITINVAERLPRVFGFGASYSTTDGAGVDGYWEHRNLFGRAERLRLEGRVSGISSVKAQDFTYGLAATFTKPGTFTPTTDLVAQLAANRESYDAYTETMARARIGFTHEFYEGLTASIALNGEISRVDDVFGKRNFLLASLPADLTYDGTDDKLEPTKGFKVKLSLEPFQEFRFSNTGLISKLEGSTYLSLASGGRYVLAARAGVGSIVGPSVQQIPNDRLFYAGGGGSVRGYGYRNIGPRLPDGRIYGGRSYVSGSLEFRAKVTDTIGVVPFIDAGSAFDSSVPNFSERIKIGAGIGLRYYTGIGAIRVDAAVPLNPGRGDPRFALYVGIGESF